MKFRNLKKEDFLHLSKAFNKPARRFGYYFREQSDGKRLVVVGEEAKKPVAYGTLVFVSKYSDFKKQRIPEIVDLNVIPSFRRKGVATAIIRYFEKLAKKLGFRQIGIGVGLEPGYGAAQRLYIKLGYMPDGRGIAYKYRTVIFGRYYSANDDLVLFLKKDL